MKLNACLVLFFGCGLLLSSCNKGGGGGGGVAYNNSTPHAKPVIDEDGNMLVCLAPDSVSSGSVFRFQPNNGLPSYDLSIGYPGGAEYSKDASNTNKATITMRGDDGKWTPGTRPGTGIYTPPTKRTEITVTLMFSTSSSGTYTSVGKTTYVSSGYTTSDTTSGTFTYQAA